MVKSSVRAFALAVVRDGWKKLTQPTVDRGKTAWPKTNKDQLNYGLRLDYDGEVDKEGAKFHKYQMQPNAGKIPSSLKNWRDNNGGTHGVMGTLYVKANGSQEDVREAMDELESSL